jgi:hypothetical protein
MLSWYVLDSMKKFRKEYGTCKDTNERCRYRIVIDEYRVDLKIAPLKKEVNWPTGKHKLHEFLLPWLRSNTVMLNAQMTSFGVVFTRGVVFRTKHCDADESQVVIMLKAGC